jgi:hypothetical protein
MANRRQREDKRIEFEQYLVHAINHARQNSSAIPQTKKNRSR